MTGAVEYIPPGGGGATQNVNLVGVNGAAPVTGAGTASGALRVELPTDGTGKVGLNASQNGIGNVGGKTTTVTVVPTLGGTTYGINYSVGGIQTLANAFTSTGSGIVLNATVNIKKVETNAFYLVIFKSAPANAIADNAACSINVADFATPLAVVQLSASSILGTQTNLSATSMGLAVNTGTTSLSVLLVCGAAMTNALTAGDVSISVTTLPDL